MSCQQTNSANHRLRSTLVVGYGQRCRSDDSIGQHVANMVASWRIPNVEGVAVSQLTADLAPQLAVFDRVIFVKAGPVITDASLQIIPLIAPTEATGVWCEPQMLLVMTQDLYGRQPQAWRVIVPGTNFGLGSCLSNVAEQGMLAALQYIDRLIQLTQDICCISRQSTRYTSL